MKIAHIQNGKKISRFHFVFIIAAIMLCHRPDHGTMPVMKGATLSHPTTMSSQKSA